MSIRIPIISEFDGKGIDRAVKEFKALEGAGAKTAFAMKKAFLPAVAAIGGLTAAAVPAVQAASDLNETISKTQVIFGQASREVIAFGDATAKTLGISKQSALDAAATFGVFGKAAGLTGNDLANFSTEFTTLAADLASFNNTTPEQAITAIGAALRGESEPIRQYGVLLSDAVLKQEALNLGIYDGTGALTAQQKVLAAQAAIYKQTGDAQGDFERTSGGLANQQRILTASIQDLQASIGKALLPVVQAVLPYITKFADWAAKNPKVFLAIAGTIGAVAAAIVAVNLAMMLNPFTAIAGGIALLVSGLVIAYNKFEWFRTGVNAVLNFTLAAAETWANGWISAINLIIRGLNLVNPFSDIPYIPDVKLPRIGGGSSGGASLAAIRAEREGNLPSTGGISLPNIIPPTGAGSAAGTAARATGAAARATTAAIPALAAPGTADGFDIVKFSVPGIAGTRQQGASVVVNITGGLATSAEIGEAVVNSIRQYNTVNGPANIAVV